MGDILYDSRYLVEHVILPKNFYEQKINFIYVMIKSGGEYVYDVTKDIIENDGGQCPYSSDDYGIHFIRMDEKAEHGNYILTAEFPMPEKEPLCIRAICIFDLDTSNNESFSKYRYFTVESGVNEGDKPFLCAWNEDGSHSNFGEVSDDIKEQVAAVVDIFTK